MPTLFFATPLLLPASHDVNHFAASCTVVIFPSSHRILHCVDGSEIKDTAAKTLHDILVLYHNKQKGYNGVRYGYGISGNPY